MGSLSTSSIPFSHVMTLNKYRSAFGLHLSPISILGRWLRLPEARPLPWKLITWWYRSVCLNVRLLLCSLIIRFRILNSDRWGTFAAYMLIQEIWVLILVQGEQPYAYELLSASFPFLQPGVTHVRQPARWSWCADTGRITVLGYLIWKACRGHFSCPSTPALSCSHLPS